MDRLPTAILGAKGWVGQHCARLLADHPYFERPTLVDIVDCGRKLKEVWQIADRPCRALWRILSSRICPFRRS